MFARRNLRRNLIISICLPIVFLCVFVVHQNHNIELSESPSFPREELTSLFSQTAELNRMKRSTSNGQLSETLINKLSKNEYAMNVNPSIIPVLNNYKQWQAFQSMIQPVIETKNLERFVHLDLKGAAPKIDYYEKLFPFLKLLGATGLLIEYEDMFPYTDHLASIKHGLAYTKTDIQRILKLAKLNALKVMPLLQVYGHLEYVLKLKEFMHLREDSRYPQVITPCLEESYKLIFGMY